jgi:hypothetical protein
MAWFTFRVGADPNGADLPAEILDRTLFLNEIQEQH